MLSHFYGFSQHFDYGAMIYQKIVFKNQSINTLKKIALYEDLYKLSDTLTKLQRTNTYPNTDLKGIHQIKAIQYINKKDYTSGLKEILKSSTLVDDEKNKNVLMIDNALLGYVRFLLQNYSDATEILKNVVWENEQSNFQQEFLEAVITNKNGYFGTAKLLLQNNIINSQSTSKFDELMNYQLLGNVMYSSKNFKDGIIFFEKSVEIFMDRQNRTFPKNGLIEYVKNSTTVSSQDSIIEYTYLRLAEGYKEQKQYDRSKTICYAILKNKAPKQSEVICKISQLLGVIHTVEKNYHEAALNFENALKVGNLTRSEENEIKILMAKNAYLQQKYSATISLCEGITEQSGEDYQNKMLAYHLLYQTYLYNSDFANSQKNLQKHQGYKDLVSKTEDQNNLAKNTKAIEAKILESNLLADLVDEAKKDLELKNSLITTKQQASDLQLLEQQNELKSKDLLFQQLERERIQKDLALLNQNLELERINSKNQQLEKEKLLEKINSKQKEQEINQLKNQEALNLKEKQLNELEVSAQKKQKKHLIYGLIVAIILIFISLILFVINLRKNKIIEKKNTLLSANNAEIMASKMVIEEKNNYIADSIEYAKNIQNALLPRNAQFLKLFSDHFIIYKPKDNVSGDSYLLLEIEDTTYISVIDCTGHGVSGAIIATVAMQQLENLIRTHKTDLNLILTNLHLYFKNKVNNDYEISTNGMDLTLLAINKQTKNMNYSGAKGSFYIGSKDELIEFKTNRFSIGQNNVLETNFQTFEHQLKNGDLLYLFTDGIIDQFNPTTNKRIGSKGFKEFLFQLKNKDFNQQEKLTLEFYNERVQNAEQTDDITLLTIQI